MNMKFNEYTLNIFFYCCNEINKLYKYNITLFFYAFLYNTFIYILIFYFFMKRKIEFLKNIHEAVLNTLSLY